MGGSRSFRLVCRPLVLIKILVGHRLTCRFVGFCHGKTGRWKAAVLVHAPYRTCRCVVAERTAGSRLGVRLKAEAARQAAEDEQQLGCADSERRTSEHRRPCPYCALQLQTLRRRGAYKPRMRCRRRYTFIRSSDYHHGRGCIDWLM